MVLGGMQGIKKSKDQKDWIQHSGFIYTFQLFNFLQFLSDLPLILFLPTSLSKVDPKAMRFSNLRDVRNEGTEGRIGGDTREEKPGNKGRKPHTPQPTTK